MTTFEYSSNKREKIAFKTSVFPQLLFSLHDKETWRGFKKIHNLQPLAFRDPPLQDNYSLYEYDSAYFEIPNEDKPKRLNSVFYCFETEISSEKFSNNKDVEHIVFMAGPVITSIDYNAFSGIIYLTDGGPGTFFRDLNLTIEEEIGKYILFTPYLKHSVQKINKDIERITIAFNFNEISNWQDLTKIEWANKNEI
jgi:hypothetical protein